MDSGKKEFRRQTESQNPDYINAYRILKNQVKQYPDNAELRYFLGYTIDRLNANYGDAMPNSKKEMTIDASEQFERVNKLEPTYKGEIIILDPYSKLSAIWGSLAMAYLNRKLFDSAKWAFAEGKRRGGFSKPFLEFNKQLLNSCEKNSILITSGDNITIPIWYLQIMENYRTDITAVDASLINTSWYTKYLKTQLNLKISFSDAAIDTIDYIPWKPKEISVINPKDTTERFNWTLYPTYMNDYILKGDRILIDIIQQNFYNRPIYFNSGLDSSYNLFLSQRLMNEGLVDRLSAADINIVFISSNLNDYTLSNIPAEEITRSKNAIALLNGFRWVYLANIYNIIRRGDMQKAKELIKAMAAKFGKDKLPFTSEEYEDYFNDALKVINKD